MTELEKAHHVLQVLHSAQPAEPATALPMLNGLTGLVRGEEGDQPLEVDEARSTAFLSICEVGKALHRGRPAGPLWTAAVTATERWLELAERTASLPGR